MTDQTKLNPPLSLKQQVLLFEKEVIKKTLFENNGNKTKSCRILGEDRKTLYNKLKA